MTTPTPSSVRLLIITDFFPPRIGGAGMVPEGIAGGLPENVTILTESFAANRQAEADYDAAQPFRVLRVHPFYGRVRWRPGKVRGLLTLLYNAVYMRPRAWLDMRRVLRSVPFNVVCLNSIASTYWMAPMLKRLRPGLKVVVYSHGEEWSTITTNAGQRWLRAIKQADMVVVISSFTRRCALDAGLAKERLRLITNGVDVQRFCPGPPSEELRRRYGLGAAPVLLCLARLDERKGQDFLLRAMPAILRAVPQTRLVLVGSGADEARLHGIVHELALERSVVFTGAVSSEEVVDWYRTATLYAMPNRTLANGDTEGFGLVFLEAGACGLPVIGGRAGGVPDAIVDGETGFLVDGRSAEAIASRCVQLLEDAELRRRMGNNALAHAQANSWQRQAQLLLEYCDALQRHAVAQVKPAPPPTVV